MDWEDVASRTQGDYTERLAVPGGWLYRSYFVDPNDSVTAVGLVFVPFPSKDDEGEPT